MNRGSEMDGDPVKILVFGEVLWDLIRDGEYLGGAPFNLAAHLASCGIHSYIITNVGDDERGRRVLYEMDRLGVDKTYVGVDPHHPTGTVNVALSQAGEPSYTINENVAYDFIVLDDAQIEKIGNERFGAFCFGTLNQREETARRTLYRILDILGDIQVFYDINLRQHYYSKEMIHKSLSCTTILKLNDDEVRMVSSLMFDEMLDDIEFARLPLGCHPYKTCTEMPRQTHRPPRRYRPPQPPCPDTTQTHRRDTRHNRFYRALSI